MKITLTPALRSELLLLVAAAIWGFAFVAQRLGMDHVGPLTFNAVRFAIGAAVLIPVVVWRGRMGAAAPLTIDLRRGVLLGLVLWVGASLQQWGLVYTTAGKAGFITGLYVVLVPLLGMIVGHRTGGRTWMGAALAAVGLYLLTVTEQMSMGRGDFLVLLGAVGWAVHVLLIARWATRTEPVRLACLQFATCAVVSGAIGLPLEQPAIADIVAASGPILYAGLLSTGVAYTLQVVAQRHAPPAHAAIILSLEAVFAVIGGVVILSEIMTTRSITGSAIMLAGMVISQIRGRPRLISRWSRPWPLDPGRRPKNDHQHSPDATGEIRKDS